MRLAIVTTHPIQYYAPVFKLIAQELDVKVFYTWGEAAQQKFDPGFGKAIAWDLPLLDGYQYEWVKNTSADAGSHHFKGIVNPDLINQIKRFGADAVLVYGWAYHSHLQVIRHFKNKLPVYFRGDSTLLDAQGGLKSILKTIFLRWVYSHINHAFYVGTNSKAYFKKYGLKDSQLTFAPHAIDNDRFSVDRRVEAGDLRQKLEIGVNDSLILFAGKFEEKKAPLLLLNAFFNLNTPSTHLLFVGNGILETELKTKAATNSHIHFMEFQNQMAMPVVYQACNLFCLPSKGPGETWGLAVNEAMAAGKPVLVSDKCGCAPDLVLPGITGDVFKSENLTDLTGKLNLLLKDKNVLKKAGDNAKKEISGWSFNKQAQAITGFIKKRDGK